jgi:hypothetical protein
MRKAKPIVDTLLDILKDEWGFQFDALIMRGASRVRSRRLRGTRKGERGKVKKRERNEKN